MSPSELIATAATASVCPRRLYTALPVYTSQILAVWSALPVTRRDPSADRATPPTQPSCPLSVCTSCAAAAAAIITRSANETNLDTGYPVGGGSQQGRLSAARAGESSAGPPWGIRIVRR